MATHVHFTRPFPREQEEGGPRLLPYPVGWRGNLRDHIAKEAIEGGYTRQSPSGDTAAAQAPHRCGASQSMSRAELDRMAIVAGLTPSDYRNKAEITKAINAA